jgi:hypothetical protein
MVRTGLASARQLEIVFPKASVLGHVIAIEAQKMADRHALKNIDWDM